MSPFLEEAFSLINFSKNAIHSLLQPIVKSCEVFTKNNLWKKG
jgi:hypothetical protein